MSTEEAKQARLTRKQKRLQRQNQQHQEHIEKNTFRLKDIEPMTENQKLVFQQYKAGKNLLLTGTAGTGKSFLSIYLGMKDIVDHKKYDKMVIIRSVVPTRDMGFLPGSHKEKMGVYESPYYSIFSEIFDKGSAYEALKNKGVVEFMSTSFVRGITINNSVIIVDEIQNMVAGELHSIFTRIGKNCKIIFAGDLKQNDLPKHKEMSGFGDFIKILSKMRSFADIEFDRNDIVRSALVKDYIVMREKLEESGEIAIL
jgi:phosphate starvation-inducible protein PhoH